MAAAQYPDYVVEDYKSNLADLATNNKYEINLLTSIASDNVHKALELSRVLENHIQTVRISQSFILLSIFISLVRNVWVIQ